MKKVDSIELILLEKGAALLLLMKGIRVGKKIDEIEVGDRIHITETVKDKDLLLYLGLTNDNNPLYIQHDYASLTPYQKPIVPPIMLNGIITSATSKYLPGPGSHIHFQNIQFTEAVYHYDTIEIILEVLEILDSEHKIKIGIEAYNEQRTKVMEGFLLVSPPY